jgi:hypothetical protein
MNIGQSVTKTYLKLHGWSKGSSFPPHQAKDETVPQDLLPKLLSEPWGEQPQPLPGPPWRNGATCLDGCPQELPFSAAVAIP